MATDWMMAPRLLRDVRQRRAADVECGFFFSFLQNFLHDIDCMRCDAFLKVRSTNNWQTFIPFDTSRQYAGGIRRCH